MKQRINSLHRWNRSRGETPGSRWDTQGKYPSDKMQLTAARAQLTGKVNAVGVCQPTGREQVDNK